jgi:hypothetical protein
MNAPVNFQCDDARQAGYNMTCSVFKDGHVGAIEITTASQEDLISIDKVRPLADKTAGRL